MSRATRRCPQAECVLSRAPVVCWRFERALAFRQQPIAEAATQFVRAHAKTEQRTQANLVGSKPPENPSVLNYLKVNFQNIQRFVQISENYWTIGKLAMTTVK